MHKSIKSFTSRLLRERPNVTRSFLTNSSPLPSLAHYYPSSPIFLPHRWTFFLPQLHVGPLFFSPHPWMLSQLSTPLLHPCAVLNLKSPELLPIARRKIDIPVKIPYPRLSLQVDESKEKAKFEIIRSFVNPPNIISVSRLLSGPVIGWMIINEMYIPSFIALAISGATDWLDGYVARRMKIDSVVGSYLDPLADKVLIGSVGVAMVYMDLLHSGLVGLVIFRDVGLVGGAFFHRARSLGWKRNSVYDFVNLDGTLPEKVKPLFISKVNTVLQIALVAFGLLQPELGTLETQLYVNYLSWVVGATTTASMVAYGSKLLGKGSTSILARKL